MSKDNIKKEQRAMARYIDADAYLKYCEENWVPLNEDAVKVQPTVDVTPVKHGKWERKDENSNEIFCSHCDYKTIFLLNSYWNYCPNCGAKMDGKEN